MVTGISTQYLYWLIFAKYDVPHCEVYAGVGQPSSAYEIKTGSDLTVKTMKKIYCVIWAELM
jgi:hypothetical protein